MLENDGKQFYMKLIGKDVFQGNGLSLTENTEGENHLIYVAEGSCTIKCSAKATRIMLRGLVYLRRYMDYTLQTDEGSGSVLVYRLHFMRSPDPRYLDLDKLCSVNPFVMEFMAFRSRICFLVDREDIYVTINELISELDSNYEDKDMMLTSQVTVLYIKMARSYHNHGKSSGITYLTEAVKFISEHSADKLSLQTIADHLGISRSYLAIIFAKYDKRKVTTFINTVRVDKAAFLLTTTDMSIIDIACAVGYGNRQHFAREFQKRYKLSPNEYRKHRKSKKQKAMHS